MSTPLTARILACRLLRRNLGCYAIGVSMLGCAAVCWLLTAAVPLIGLFWIQRPDLFRHPQPHPKAMSLLSADDETDRLLHAAWNPEAGGRFLYRLIEQIPLPLWWASAAVLLLVVLFDLYGGADPFYLRQPIDPFAPDMEQERRFAVGHPGQLLLAIACLAPALTRLAIHFFRAARWPTLEELSRAVQAYHLLVQSGDWQSYPPFLSQRRILLLLVLAGMIRISKRFGRLEVKAVRDY